MAKIGSYDNQDPISPDDKWLGTRASDGKTMNFTAEAMLDLVGRTLTLPKYDVPSEIYIATTPKNSGPTVDEFYLTYIINDELKKLDLFPFVPDSSVNRGRGMIRKGNTIYIKTITGNGSTLNEPNQLGLLKVVCDKINDTLVVNDSQYVAFPTVNRGTTSGYPNNMHSEAIIGDYLYLATRTLDDFTGDQDNVPTQVFKINLYDISDVTEYSIPYVEGFTGHVGEMQAYEDWLYLLYTDLNSPRKSYLVRLDKDFRTQESLLVTGDVSSARVAGSSPFKIYRDEIYIPVYYNSTSPAGMIGNTIGIKVFSVKDHSLVRENLTITISTELPAGIGGAIPHWMTIENGKILLHTCTGGSTNNKRLVRIDCNTLELDGPIDTGENVASIYIGYNITNNNSLLNQWVYLNPEDSSYDKPLIRYWYKDFSNSITEVASGYYATGSPENEDEPGSLKTNISQFKNDGDGTSPYATEAFVEELGNGIIEYSGTYSGTPVWTGTTAPSSLTNTTYRATQTGKHVKGHILLFYGTAGTALTRCDLPLPAGLPTPADVPGASSTNNFPYPVDAFMATGASVGKSSGGASGGLQKTASGYQLVLVQSSGNYRTVSATFEYWTD